MRRLVSMAAVAAALTVPAAADGATRLGGGPLHALSADETTAVAVVESGQYDKPLRLVRSTGGRARSPVDFGDVGAEMVDLAYDPDGMVVTWGRPLSTGERWHLAPITDLAGYREVGQGAGHARVAIAGDTRWLTGPDRFSDAGLIAVTADLNGQPATKLSENGPYTAHMPLDIAIGPDDEPMVLDLTQTRARTELRVEGTSAPTRALVSDRGVHHSRGTIAVTGRTIRVAYLHKGRAHLATASTSRGARWRVRALPGPGGGVGMAAVTDAGEVLYAQSGAGGSDVYFWDGRRSRRITSTSTDEQDVMLARASNGRVYAGWTQVSLRTDRENAMIQRVR